MSNNCQCGNNCEDEKIKEILSKYEKDKSNLIQILNEVQETYGYIPESVQLEISKYLGLEMAQIYSVITFYARFSLKP